MAVRKAWFLISFLFVTLFMAMPNVLAQPKIKQVAEDGFSWYSVGGPHKRGIENENGRIIVPMQYDTVLYFPISGGWFSACKLNSEAKISGAAFYDRDGTCIIPIERGYATMTKLCFWDNIWYMTSDGNMCCGVCDALGRELIPPIYDIRKDGILNYDYNNDTFYLNKLNSYERIELNVSLPKDLYAPADPSIPIEDLFENAYNTSDNDYLVKKERYLRVIDADPNNWKGYKALSYNNLGVMYKNKGKYKVAKEYYKKALAISPSYKQARKNLNKARGGKIVNGLSKATKILGVIGLSIAEAGAEYAAVNNTNLYNNSNLNSSAYGQTGSAGQSASVSKKNTSSANKSRNDASEMYRERNTYSNDESLLIKMSTYPEKYDDKERRNIQSRMKRIRQKWEARGYDMPHSKWEDWGGL